MVVCPGASQTDGTASGGVPTSERRVRGQTHSEVTTSYTKKEQST